MSYIRSNEEWQQKHDADMAFLAKKHFAPTPRGRPPFRDELLSWLANERRRTIRTYRNIKTPIIEASEAADDFNALSRVQKLARKLKK